MSNPKVQKHSPKRATITWFISIIVFIVALIICKLLQHTTNEFVSIIAAIINLIGDLALSSFVIMFVISIVMGMDNTKAVKKR
ncbi:hypothetical protein [uncultured Clostridium sp.]|uniref:hypothetical protein n=1 Tax=uncultured Clostridium sp. TaxID=59620 RepID=UPI002621F136|nr:hypothetical protein [uncultured Clostridium sp.]